MSEINVTELRARLFEHKERHGDGIAITDTEQIAALLDAVEALRGARKAAAEIRALDHTATDTAFRHEQFVRQLANSIVVLADSRLAPFRWEA